MILTAISLGLSCLMFPPINWGWVGFVVLVPWLVCVCTATSAKCVYLLSLLLGLGFIGINIAWMIPVTIPGYAALTIYSALFFPLAAWPIRHMHRRHGVSVALTGPIVWTAAEFLRSSGDVAFPWLLLGHTQYKYLTMIQIADVAGAYGVSFVVAMVNGWLTDLLIQPILIWRSDRITRFPLGTLTLAVVLLGTCIYGRIRMSPDAFQPGPRIAVVQHDFPMYVDERTWRTPQDSIFRAYACLAEQAAREKPDLILLPETAMSGYLNAEFINASASQLEEIRLRRFPHWSREDVRGMQAQSKMMRDALQRISTDSGVPMIVGCLAIEWKPTAIPPRVEAYNSSFLLLPGKTEPTARYDKNHLVLFGEYVPFRHTYHSVYQWLNGLTPWGAAGIEYSLGFGSSFAPFEFNAASRPGRSFRAGTPICYEEIMPYVGREFARGRGPHPRDREKGTDLLLTISNDGWFLHTAELEQHLAGAVFRAVENRVGVARAVNTGASGFVLPNGQIVDRVALAPEDRPKLVTLRSEIVALQDRAARLNESNSPATAATEFVKQMVPLRTALARLGKAYAYMDDRTTRLAWKTSSTSPPDRAKAVETLQDQLRMDIETVDRWHARPDTAPGISCAEVPCDGRVTLYTRWGDWLSQGAAALAGMMILDWMLRRLWRKLADKEDVE